MPSVEIGKYGRPGIFTEYFDNSVIDSVNVVGNQVLVMGSSRKGPVNTPVLLQSQNDLREIFGDLDRRLESKESYFHRTISKVLESSPVIAVNLLNPDDELDTLEYKSVSTSTAYDNDLGRSASYRRFFDTSTFWKKDREAFLSIVDDNPNDSQRVMHFTNMSDREITVFVFKAQETSGFDVALEKWYGSPDKVPFYLSGKDYASDYLVDVLVVQGDWTNYSDLAVDPTWDKYFNTSGLIKSEAFNFVNDRNVNTLRIWRNLSLIPYFRDANDINIFIETRINQETNTTGLYCAYDIDAVENTDFRNGLLDLNGNSLISNNDAEEINFLSYNEQINEIKNYSKQELDRPGNTYKMTYDTYYEGTDRKAVYSEGFVAGLAGPTASELDGSYPSDIGYGTVSISFTASTYTDGDAATYSPFAVIGGSTVSLSTTTFNYLPEDFTTSSTNPGTTQSFTKVLFIDTDGSIKDSPTNNQLANGVVLGYIDFIVALDSVRDKYFLSVDYTPVSVNSSGFINFDTTGVTYSVNGTGTEITYEFLDTTSVASVTDYVNYRKFKVFNQFVSILSSTNADRAAILVDAGTPSNGNPWKKSIEDLTVTITNTATANKSIKFAGFDAGTLDGSSILETHGIVLHTTDDEFVLLNSKGAITTNDWVGVTYGIVGKYSDLYQDYKDGVVNTGDKFYENLIDGFDNTSESVPSYIQFLDVNGNDYIVSDVEINFQTNDIVKIPEAISNTGTFTVTDTTPVTSGLTGASGSYFGYLVSENTTAETVSNPTKIWNTSQTFYLKFYTVNDILTVEFTGSSLTSPATSYNRTLDIVSQDSNFRQTLEIEEPTGYTVISNKVLVNADRYTEVKIGDFLEALVDENNIQVGEVPRRMTRILSKKIYSGDSTLVEITCDSAIKKYTYGENDKQTYRFSSIDNYVSNYKGISLFGWRVRTASLPDGTEARFNDILNIAGKGTPFYNALTDKNIIDFRYLVDSFGGGLAAQSKQQLADIVGKRLDCFGILNMPSIKAFRNSTSPTFVDSEGRLSTDFIKQGGDPESSPAFNYSLATGDGESAIAYFGPYLTVNDNGRPKNIPPASYVAATFLRKHSASIPSVTPWTIAAGITDGQIRGIAGLEYDFNDQDIKNLNAMKVNPIVSKKNRGRVIETENTAQTLNTSALSYIHVREVLIELERDLSDMLLNFQWKYNTPEIRAEIKLRADSICADYVNRNGLFNFFNKIDAENNTQTIIDNQYGVLDTFVEPIKGMGTIVNNITILKTGDINSGGFI